MKFKSKIILNDETQKDYRKSFLFKNKKLYLYCGLLSVMFICGVLNLAFKNGLSTDDHYFDGFLICFPIIFFLMLFITYRHSNKILSQRNKEMNVEDQELIYEFLDDEVKINNIKTKAEVTIQYASFIHFIENKKMLILYTKSKLSILVDKEKFITGNYEEFKKFIKEKCINVKMK